MCHLLCVDTNTEEDYIKSMTQKNIRILTIAAIVVALAGGVWYVLHHSGMCPYWIVEGRVVDEIGNPVEGARVAVWFCFEDERWATTGAEGNFLVTVGSFSWTSCKRTPIQLRIEKPGYRTKSNIYKPWSWGPKFTRVTINLRKSDPSMRGNVDRSSYDARDVDLALLDAIEEERLEVVERLLEQGADVNTYWQGWTVLMRASSKKRLDVMELLLKKGADINAKDRWRGETALIRVSSNSPDSSSGYGDVVKLLLEKGALVNEHDSQNGMTALMWASFRGHLDIVKLLLEKGADINAKDRKGHTSLNWTLRGKQARIAELLKAYGAKE